MSTLDSEKLRLISNENAQLKKYVKKIWTSSKILIKETQRDGRTFYEKDEIGRTWQLNSIPK